jgi:hypothetical protein
MTPSSWIKLLAHESNHIPQIMSLLREYGALFSRGNYIVILIFIFT